MLRVCRSAKFGDPDKGIPASLVSHLMCSHPCYDGYYSNWHKERPWTEEENLPCVICKAEKGYVEVSVDDIRKDYQKKLKKKEDAIKDFQNKFNELKKSALSNTILSNTIYEYGIESLKTEIKNSPYKNTKQLGQLLRDLNKLKGN